MRKIISILCITIVFFVFFSCASVPSTTRGRSLILNGYTVLETDFGGVERWYAVDKYNYDSLVNEVRLQVGYFKENNMGFILYGKETIGEVAIFHRDGLNLRWDWGIYEKDGESFCKYSFLIKPDGTGLYYDFGTSKDGTTKPSEIYKVYKF